MNYEIKIKISLDEHHINLIKELKKNSSTIDVLENKKGFAFTWIADLEYQGIVCRNSIGHIWLTQIGKQICGEL